MGDVPAIRRARATIALVLVALAACTAPGRGGAARVDASARPGEPEPFDVRLWRAGRAFPPGLSAARAAELEAERTRVLAELAAARGTCTELERRLADPDVSDELWCAAARAAAALECYAAAPALVPALDDAVRARRAVAARAALHGLYGLWFQRAADAEPYVGTVERGAGTRLLLAALAAEEARSRERLLAGLATDPARATAFLGDPDPGVRSGAARILGRALVGGGPEPEQALARLVVQLETEREPQAFHDALSALLPALERSDPDAAHGLRLRALLLDLARVPGDPRTLSAAGALARLPWRGGGPRDTGHVLTGVDALGAMLRGGAEADRARGANDPDPLVGVLAALGELCARARAAGLSGELRASPAREGVLAVLSDPQQDPAVRAAAAGALGALVRPTDATRLAGVLVDPAVAAPVKHALLGSLRPLLPELGPDVAGAGDLLAAVATSCAAEDADLRRRALELLAEPGLEPLVRVLDPRFLVRLLEREDGRDATVRLLGLVARFGRADMLHPLLALPRFDRMCADPALLEPLATALVALAAGVPEESLAAARCLAGVRAEETHLARLRHALTLVAALDDASAASLAPGDHRIIAAWAWRVARAGSSVREATPRGLAFERRLLDVHLPRAERAAPAEMDVLPPAEAAHLAALLRADLFLAGAQHASKPQAESAFESAQALAPAGEARYLVLRDRARFRAAANEGVKALGDYRRLVEAGPAAAHLLGIQDLRAAVGLIGRLDAGGGAASPATAGEACDLFAAIVARQAWRAEPASVRMQDLREWTTAALAAQDPRRLRALEAALADLPLTQAEGEPDGNAAEPPVWLGLTREPGWFQELLDLRARARLGLRELDAQG